MQKINPEKKNKKQQPEEHFLFTHSNNQIPLIFLIEFVPIYKNELE